MHQVIDVRKAGSAAHLDNHNNRRRCPPNASELKQHENVMLVGDRKETTAEAVDKCISEKYKGTKAIRKDAIKFVQVMVSASPEYFRPDPDNHGYADPQRLALWLDAMKRYMEELPQHGKGYCVQAQLHMDETTPHIHMTVVPIDAEGHLNANKAWFRGKAGMSRNWDELHKYTAPLGLERGEKRTTEEHLEQKRINSELFFEKSKAKADIDRQIKAAEKAIEELDAKYDDIAEAWQSLMGEIIPDLETRKEGLEAEIKAVTAELEGINQRKLAEKTKADADIKALTDAVDLNLAVVARIKRDITDLTGQKQAAEKAREKAEADAKAAEEAAKKAREKAEADATQAIGAAKEAVEAEIADINQRKLAVIRDSELYIASLGQRIEKANEAAKLEIAAALDTEVKKQTQALADVKAEVKRLHETKQAVEGLVIGWTVKRWRFEAGYAHEILSAAKQDGELSEGEQRIYHISVLLQKLGDGHYKDLYFGKSIHSTVAGEDYMTRDWLEDLIQWVRSLVDYPRRLLEATAGMFEDEGQSQSI